MKKRGLLALAGLAYLGLPYALVQVANLGLVRRGRGPSTAVALTFDDGPDPATTPRVLDALKAANVRATFFMLGEAAARYPDLARRVKDEGHEVAAHGSTHRHAWARAPWQIAPDARASLRTLREVTGEGVRFFRPPHGAYTLASVLALRALHLQGVHWTVEAHDWHPDYTPQDVVARVLQHVESGGVIVLHDAGKGGQTAAEALPDLLRELRARGYAPGALGELPLLRPEVPRDLVARALKLLDGVFDRANHVVRFGVNANSLLRAAPAPFPFEGHPQFPKGTSLLELHVNSERVSQFADKPLTGVRLIRDSLRELARALRERDEWQGVPGVFALGPFSDLLSALGFSVSDAPPEITRRLGPWTAFLRWAYGSANQGAAHEVRMATITREELLRRYGK